MKIIGKIEDINNVTPEEREKYFLHQNPVYDWQSCACQFGFNCDEHIHPKNRIVGWEDIETKNPII